jgi:hypothetical protein
MTHYLREGLIGGFVVAILTVSEFLAHDFLYQHANWAVWLMFGIAFVIGFVGISWFAAWVQSLELRAKKKELSKKISLDRIGEVDGFYMYLVTDVKTDSQHASVMEIQSSVAAGFMLVGGQTYNLRFGSNGKVELVESGWFRGEGHKTRDSVTYSYTGGILQEGPGESGFGHYDFRQDRLGHLHVDGWFMVHEKTCLRQVQGRKLKSNELDSQSVDVLELFLNTEGRKYIRGAR